MLAVRMVATGDVAVCPTCGQAYPSRIGHCANDGTKLVQRRAHAISVSGRVLNNQYLVGEPIGEGMLGAVYGGKQYAIDRDVAIKVIKPSLIADPAAGERLFHAARAACQLAGPSVATVFDIGRTEDGVTYVIAEYVRGHALAQDLATKIPNYQAVAVAIQMCDALATAAAIGLGHGDLKPHNVFVLDDGKGVKLADFGLARALIHDPWSMPPELARYVAPELANLPEIEPRSDLYSLGCILYEMLAGKPAFDDPSTKGLLDKAMHDMPARLPREVPPALSAIVMRLLAKTPRERYQSASEVRAALMPMNPTASTAPATVSAPGAFADAPSQPYRRDRTGPNTQPPMTVSRTGATPGSGNSQAPAGFGVYHPKTGAHPQPIIPGGQSGVYHPKTGVHAQPNVPNYAPVPVPVPLPAPLPTPEPPKSRRALVIAIVAIVLSGGGVLAYLAATGAL